jgi:hypothetical protein
LKTIIGVILIVLGILAFAYPKISYKDREAVLNVGPLQATAETRKELPISPVLGGAAVVAGVLLIALGARKTT